MMGSLKDDDPGIAHIAGGQELAYELRAIRTTLKKLDIKINALEARLDSKMDTLEAKLDSKIYMGAERVKREVMFWVGGVGLLQMLLIVGLVFKFAR